jgi:transcriptional regulator with XRE-family HTH domain
MAQRLRPLTPDASPHHHFGALLRECRQRRQLSQAQLAALIHVSPDLIAKVEKASRWPANHFATLCDAALDTGGVLTDLMPVLDQERRRRRLVGLVADAAVALQALETELPWNL